MANSWQSEKKFQTKSNKVRSTKFLVFKWIVVNLPAMKKILFVVLAFLSTVFQAQIRSSIQQKIDSISQKRWDSVAIDLDSLANPKLINLETKFKDTIVIHDKLVIANVTGEVPITPYHLMRMKDPIKWFYFGQNNLVFNQSSFSNWNSGGNNNIGVIGKVNYIVNYKSGKHFLDNQFKFGYGFVSTRGEAARKTEDYINIMSNYGYDIGKNFYLSTGFQFLSQFAPGYNYSATPNPEFSDRISRFMAPGYLNVGLGISYNPKENFQVIFRPINGKFTFVNDPLLQKAGKYGLERDGHSMKADLGALLNILYRLKIYENIDFTNQVNFFSSYISHSERVDVTYNGTLDIRFNRFISAVVGLDLMYDHDQIQKLQMKQTLGIGFSYNFGFENKERSKKFIKPFIAN